MPDPDISAHRAIIETALAQIAPHTAVEGGLLTGWVVVAEYMDPDGRRWLCRLGSEDITMWAREGMLFNALHGEWAE